MADDTTATSDQTTNDASQTSDASNGEGQQQGNAGTFTQADIDRVVRQRLARAEKDWQAKADEARRQAAMTEEEKLKAKVAEADQRAQDAEARAAARLVAAEARVQAASLGVKPERIAAVLKLADLTGVGLGEDGEPQADALKSAIGNVLRDYPEFKGGGQAASVGGGSNPAGGGGNQQQAPDMDAAIASGNPTTINAAFEALLRTTQRGR